MPSPIPRSAARAAIALAVALIAVLAHAASDPGSDDAERLHRLFDDEWERGLAENPVRASRLGDRRYDDQWSDLSLEAIEASHAADRADLERFLAIDPEGLSEVDRLNHELFGLRLQNRIEEHRFRTWLMPVSQRGGIQTLDQVGNRIRMQTAEDYENWLKRLEQLPELIGQTRMLMEMGVAEGRVPPKVLMERVPRQIARQVVDDPEDSLFWARFETMPDAIPAAEQERLRAAARRVIAQRVVPAYAGFQAFFEDTYLPACRDTIGASELPDGRDFYEFRARRYTTTTMTPDEIHALGLAEVKRIRAEMDQVIEEVAFEGSFEAFLDFLRTDPQFYYDDPDELLQAYRAITRRIDPQLIKLFGKLPRMPYGVIPIPETIAPDTTTAYYNRPAADGSRAGYYYVNLYKPETRPKYEMEVLSVHEAVPGHHLQIALAMELEDSPEFRRYGGFTAFVEGWGLYSERLGYEIGLYEDPYSRFGALTYDMWRAVRLVVDTGMHYKGWTRQQAIDFFTANAAKSELDIVNEIDRYIGWPGQALAYKVGQLKFIELRERATEVLGDDFDVREFHDVVLSRGAVPLSTLEAFFDEWLEGRLAAAAD